MSLAEAVRLAEGQVVASGAVLARAFANDPFFTYVLSDPAERERLMPPLMTAWTRYGLLFGEVYVTAGPVEASAIWLAPGAQTEAHREQAGLTAVVSAFSVGARAHYDAIVQHQSRIREAVPSVPHWHLPFIGVDPARQGLGLGSPRCKPSIQGVGGGPTRRKPMCLTLLDCCAPTQTGTSGATAAAPTTPTNSRRLNRLCRPTRLA